MYWAFFAVNLGLALISLGSAAFVWVQYAGLWSRVSSHDSSIQSIRNTQRYDEAKVRDLIEQELDGTLPSETDKTGSDMQEMMQMMMMMQGLQGAQSPSGPSQKPTSEGTPGTDEAGSSSEEGTPLFDDEGWLTTEHDN